MIDTDSGPTTLVTPTTPTRPPRIMRAMSRAASQDDEIPAMTVVTLAVAADSELLERKDVEPRSKTRQMEKAALSSAPWDADDKN